MEALIKARAQQQPSTNLVSCGNWCGDWRDAGLLYTYELYSCMPWYGRSACAHSMSRSCLLGNVRECHKDCAIIWRLWVPSQCTPQYCLLPL